MRRKLVMGNWKMHGSLASVEALLNAVRETLPGTTSEVAVCPPAVHVPLALDLLADTGVSVGGQNCSDRAEGAYTGEVAAAMLADLGCDWVILGHSERRQYFGESSELVAAKAVTARAAGLKPVLCVGETLEQREAGQALDVVREQLGAVLAGLEPTDVIAYEPVWAIGTGVTATPEKAQEMHAGIREYLRENWSGNADELRLLYGGSVKADNAAELFACEDIDGGLVGGASLKAAEFVAIAQA